MEAKSELTAKIQDIMAKNLSARNDGTMPKCAAMIADLFLKDRRRILERVRKLTAYTAHESSCLCSQWRQGRPMADGGYETLYGYGKNEKWYQRGEYPPCSCGLNAIIDSIGEGKDTP